MRIPVATGLIALAVALGGCTATATPGEAFITASAPEPEGPLVPSLTVDAGGARVIDSIFAGLVYYTPDGSIANDVADTISSNPSQTVFTITLRDSLRFSDGAAVDAESFAKAWDWTADSANLSPDQRFFSDVKGYLADDPETPDVERSSLIETGGLVVVDAHTLQVTLKAPTADFPQRLGLRAFFPLPPEFFDDPEQFGAHPVGNGPYMLAGPDAWQHGKQLDLFLNPSYDGPRIPVNGGVSLRFYDSAETAYIDVLAGFLDVIDTIPVAALPNFDEELGFRSVDQPGAQLESLSIPIRLPHLNGREGALRRAALSLAIDREGITRDTFDGLRLPARDFTAPVVDGYSDGLSGSEVLTFDDDEAKARWAAAEEMSPWEGRFEIAYAADSGQEAAAEATAAGIAAVLGIETGVIAFPTAEELDAAIADRSLESAYITDYTGDYPAPLPYLGPFFLTKAPSNGTVYTSKLFDADLRAALRGTTASDVAGGFQDAQRTLLVDLPALPLWYSTMQAGWGENVDGLTLDWQGIPQYYLVTKKQ